MHLNKQQIKFNQTIHVMISNKVISGASWAFIDFENTIYYHHGFLGFVEGFHNLNVTEEAIYDLASLTKVIGTTTRILQLIDQSRLSWHTKVSDVFTDFSNLNCTIEQLLTHSSGLPADFTHKQNLTWEKVRSNLMKYSVTNEKQDITYSDIGYIILGKIIEQIDNSDLEASFKHNIFQPMGIEDITFSPSKQSVFVPTEVNDDGVSLVGIVHDRKARNLNRPIGSAGLFAPLREVVKFSRSLMFNQINDNASLFDNSTYQKILGLNNQGRTIGWEWLKEDVLFHTGFTGTSIGLDVKNQKGLILLTNRIHPTRNNKVFITKSREAYLDFFKGEIK